VLLIIAVNYSGVTIDGIKGMASVFFVDSSTPEILKDNFAVAKEGRRKMKILIVPGHDDGLGGTEFRGINERDLNIKVAEEITKLLRSKSEFSVYLTRNKYVYNKDIQTYIGENYENIKEFIKKHKSEMKSLVQSGLIDTRIGVEHNNAPSDTIIRLYGINKWANENGIDIVIHVHFNDYPGRRYNRAGKYSGITIYVPEKQFSNSKGSFALAKDVFDRLTTYSASSDMPMEKSGIVEDQELIAIGAYNTLDPAVLLIEYGYIYEQQFMSQEVSNLAIKELAMQTYLGITDFFESTKLGAVNIYNSSTLPYVWGENLKRGTRNNKDVFALQTALAFQFFYPPNTKDKNDCPINGSFGPCTEKAVISFQKSYGIKPSSGFVGPTTRSKLNELYPAR